MAFEKTCDTNQHSDHSTYGERVRRYQGCFVGDVDTHDVPEGLDRSKLVTDYFDVSTNFYLAGWGRSFHFAPRSRSESLSASLQRYERTFASQLGVATGDRVLDLGCGVAGPMIAIASQTGASITGINNNAYQLGKARQFIQAASLADQCQLLLADFMQLPIDDNSIDAIYSIEAVPHAPEKSVLFSEVFRVLRPGGLFVASDWCLTKQFDDENIEHRKIERNIELGNGLPGIWKVSDVRSLLEEAGFDIVRFEDLATAKESPIPWYSALAGGSLSPMNWLRGPRGRRLVGKLLGGAERLRLVPRGTAAVQEFLSAGAAALVAGGQAKIFTPLLFWQVRKPL